MLHLFLVSTLIKEISETNIFEIDGDDVLDPRKDRLAQVDMDQDQYMPS